MKKLLTIFILFTIQVVSAYAAAITPNCPAGQYYNATTGCSDCAKGKWSAGGEATSCGTCNRPAGATFTTNGKNENDCQWEITCPAGKGWSGTQCTTCTGTRYQDTQMTITGKGASTTAQQCSKQCPTNAKTNTDGTSCICADHFYDVDGVCTGKIYKINLKKNCKICTVNENPIYQKYSSGFAYNTNNPTKWTSAASFQVPLDSKNQNTSRWWGIKFSGYFTKPSGGNKVIDQNGKLMKDSDIQFTDETTLYAQYDSQSDPITIVYTESGQADNSVACYPDNGCTIAYPKTSCIAGQIFQGWQCTSGCDNSPPYFQPGAKFEDIQNYLPLNNNPIQITLTATFSDCTKGKYCTCEAGTGKQHNCPVGSTSGIKATAITDCYIKRGNGKSCDEAKDATCFCDKDGCFTLPGTGNIKYHTN